jgi:hypothetical protein
VNSFAVLIARWIAPGVVRFLGGSPWRFLLLLLFGAAVMLAGLIHETLVAESKPERVGLSICFLVYAAAALWYARRIQQGTWQRVWTRLAEVMSRD